MVITGHDLKFFKKLSLILKEILEVELQDESFITFKVLLKHKKCLS